MTHEILLLTRRLLIEAAHNPPVLLGNLAVSVFFLVVYDGVLGGSEPIRTLAGGNYLNFILPVAALSASIAGGTAGLALVADLQSGYFRRLLTMPVRRGSIVASTMLLGAVQVLGQTLVIVLLGLALGARPEAGALGLVVLVGIAFVWGMGYASYSVVIALRTGDSQATQAGGLLFLPLIFLTPVFLPQDQLQGWVEAAATYNPTTYILLGMRSVMTEGWEVGTLLKAAGADLALAALMLGLALYVARAQTTPT